MIPVWLVRHGEAAAKWAEHPDPGLSELGIQQSERAADLLMSELGERVSIISSPKARAMETARPLQRQLGVELSVSPAYREIEAPVPLEQRQDWLRGFMQQHWSQQPETQWQWRRGIISAMEAITEPTVIFTHFLVINAAVAHCREADATLQCWPDNGSVHRFGVQQSRLTLESLGRQMQSPVG